MTENEIHILTEVHTDIQWLKSHASETKDWQDKVDKHLSDLNGKVKTHDEILNNKEQGLIKRVCNLEKRTWLLILAVSVFSGGTGAAASQWLEEVLRQSTNVSLFETLARLIG